MKICCVACVAVILSVLAVCIPARAQGTAADYARAEGLAKKFADKVYRSSVTPHWLSDGRFWYRNDLPGGRREFLVVDPVGAKKHPAFDAAKLAAALAKKLGKSVDPARLLVENITFDAKTGELRIQVGDRTYGVTEPGYTLTELETPLGQAPRRGPEDGPRRSRDGGTETFLTFFNRSGAEVTLFWIDSGGETHEYGTLRPDEQKRQHTFEGHLWLVRGKDGTELALYTAQPESAVAIIDGKQPASSTRRRTRSSGENRSPDGKWEVYFRAHNVILRNVADGTQTPLTNDGKSDDRYEGRVYWSPNSQRVVVMKTIPAQERKVSFVESSPKDQLQPKLRTIDYLKPGDRIAHPRPHLFDVSGKKDIPVDDRLFPNPWDIDSLEWGPDSRRFTFLYNERGHQVLRLVGVDAVSGVAKALIQEESKTFIDYSSKTYMNRLPKTGEAIWMSERDGWNHLYLYDTVAGIVKNQITRGEWLVRGVDRVDEAKRQIWFRAGGIIPGQDPYYIQYCRINFDGSGLTLLTEGDGTHTAIFSPDNQYLLDTFSRADMAPVSVLRRVSDGKKVLDLERGDDSELRAEGWHPPEQFTAKARDGVTDIYGLIYRPTNFDPVT